MIYVISDLHFGHDKPFIYEKRGFNSVEEMNTAIVERWNNIVTDEDTVIILGDVLMGKAEENIKYLFQLKGQKKIVIGNHDTDRRCEMYTGGSHNISVAEGFRYVYKGYRFWMTHYPTLCDNYDDGTSLKKRVINLCGHTHTTDPFSDWDKGTIYHVDCDAHNCTPISLDAIIRQLKEKTGKIKED